MDFASRSVSGRPWNTREANGILSFQKTQEYQLFFAFCIRNTLPALPFLSVGKYAVGRNLIDNGGADFETENH